MAQCPNDRMKNCWQHFNGEENVKWHADNLLHKILTLSFCSKKYFLG